jgi:hypothetical protein
VSADAEPVGHVRLGYARAWTTRQSLDAQLDSLAEAGVTRVFSEKISTRATKRPELKVAVTLAGEIRSSGVAVTLVVHEHKRLGRGIELAMLAEELKASDVGLELLTGELKGSHDPSGIVFTVLAAMSGMEREYIRDCTLEGHESARKRAGIPISPRCSMRKWAMAYPCLTAGVSHRLRSNAGVTGPSTRTGPGPGSGPGQSPGGRPGRRGGHRGHRHDRGRGRG